MRAQLILVFFLLIATVSCSGNELPPQKNGAKAKIMYPSCGGTVLQFIESRDLIGTDWLWFKDLSAPFNASNPALVYPKCVTAFGVPKDQEIIENVIEFTYDRITYPPGIICAIGGLPVTYIAITHVNP